MKKEILKKCHLEVIDVRNKAIKREKDVFLSEAVDGEFIAQSII